LAPVHGASSYGWLTVTTRELHRTGKVKPVRLLSLVNSMQNVLKRTCNQDITLNDVIESIRAEVGLFFSAT